MKRPIYLFSDSQLLFWKEEAGYFTERFLPQGKHTTAIKAAYIGASNGDNPDYFEIFRQAMQQIGVTTCLLISSRPAIQDLEFLKMADIILLAGGDVKLGRDVMLRNGVAELIRNQYERGTTLVGISAGTIQLSLMGFDSNKLFDTFQLVPFIIDVHDEANDWGRLSQIVTHNPGIKAYGIPFGAGLIYHPDGHVEMVRQPSMEF